MESSSQQWFWKFQQQKQLTLVADSPPARGLTIKIPPRKWDAETMAENAARKITVGWNMERKLTANLVINSASARTKWRVRKCRKITRISTYGYRYWRNAAFISGICSAYNYCVRVTLPNGTNTLYSLQSCNISITCCRCVMCVMWVCMSVEVSTGVSCVCVCQSKCQLAKCLVRYFYCCYVTCTPPTVKCCSGAYVPYN